MGYAVVVYAVVGRPGRSGLVAVVVAVLLAGAGLLPLTVVLRRYAAARAAVARYGAEVGVLRRQVADGHAAARRAAAGRDAAEGEVARLQGLLQERSGLQERVEAGFQVLTEQVGRLADRSPVQGAAEREVFTYVGHRLHALVSRALAALTKLERGIEDPDLLDPVFGIDHLVTQARRVAERMAELGGQKVRRRTRPVLLSAVLRESVAETEHYRRVTIKLPDRAVAVPGYAADVINLLAELVENATKFSKDEVRLQTVQVPGGLGIEVRDRGLAMSPTRLAAANRLLAEPQTVDLHGPLREGRIGLLVSARIAARHGIHVELRPNDPAGDPDAPAGTTALVVLPDTLLIPADTQVPHPADPQGPAALNGAVPAPPAVPGAVPPPAADLSRLPQRNEYAPPQAALSTQGPVDGSALPRRRRADSVPRRPGTAPSPATSPTTSSEGSSPSAAGLPTAGLMANFQRGARQGAQDPPPADSAGTDRLALGGAGPDVARDPQHPPD